MCSCQSLIRSDKLFGLSTGFVILGLLSPSSSLTTDDCPADPFDFFRFRAFPLAGDSFFSGLLPRLLLRRTGVRLRSGLRSGGLGDRAGGLDDLARGLGDRATDLPLATLRSLLGGLPMSFSNSRISSTGVWRLTLPSSLRKSESLSSPSFGPFQSE